MVNPHWDEEINEDITVTDLPPWSPQQEWGDVGGFGEFTGSEGQEVLPSPNMPGSYRGGPEGWGNYRADEFTGIETLKKNPWDFRRGALQGIPSSAISGNRRGPGPWNDFRMGMEPWPMDNGMMDNDMMDEIMMAKIYQSGDPGMINKGSKWNFMPGGDPLWDEVSPQGEAINTVLEMPIIQQMITEGGFNYEDFMRVIPESLRRELPRDAFQSKSDFMKQQPITVI